MLMIPTWQARNLAPQFPDVRIGNLMRGRSSTVEQLEFPLRQVGGSNPTRSLHVNMREINHQIAKPFIEHWHYEHKVPTGRNLFFGCYVDNSLFAVANYGKGAAMAREFSVAAFIAKTFPELGLSPDDELWHLQRLCRVGEKDEKGPIPLTQFLAFCHRELRKKGVRAVISYSDPANSHHGGIYRAANFRYLGQTAAEWHVIDKQGIIRHRRVAYKFMQRENARARAAGVPAPPLTLADARGMLGFTRHQTSPRDRWFLDLGPLPAKRQPRMPRPSLPPGANEDESPRHELSRREHDGAQHSQ
jgi:hypothetical protein